MPVDEVLDILAAALPPSASGSPPPKDALFCFPGSYASRDAATGAPGCTVCPLGTYAFAAGSPACKACAPGRYADTLAAAACRTCQPGSYSAPDGTSCLPCPTGEAGARLHALPSPGSSRVRVGLCAYLLPAALGASLLAADLPAGDAAVPPPRAGTFSMLPGAWSAQQCASAEERRKAQEDQALSVAMLRYGAWQSLQAAVLVGTGRAADG